MRDQCKVQKFKRFPISGIFLLFILFVLSYPSWCVIEAVPGDVNKDGAIDILDIQNGINIAIGLSEHVPMADANQNDVVDVLDIQILINTVLGVGGLVQPVEGRVSLGQNGGSSENTATIVALSEDGRIVSSEVTSPNTNFRLLLPVGVSWSLGIVCTGGNSTLTVPFVTSIGAQRILSIPFVQLSTGTPLSVGTINAQQSIVKLSDLRHILGSIAEPLPNTDGNGNQVPDIYEQVVNSVKDKLLVVPYLQSLGFNATLFDGLIQSLANCIQPHINILLMPSMDRIENEGYPEMVLPLIQCVKQILKDYLVQTGIPGIEGLADTIMNQLQQELQQKIREWLNSLNIPEVTDTNGNNIPDFIEGRLCTGIGCVLDSNNNGVPDFIEDADSDGTPNYLDMDNRTESDLDGDGVTNEADLDANGNGVLDYAETKN